MTTKSRRESQPGRAPRGRAARDAGGVAPPAQGARGPSAKKVRGKAAADGNAAPHEKALARAKPGARGAAKVKPSSDLKAAAGGKPARAAPRKRATRTGKPTRNGAAAKSSTASDAEAAAERDGEAGAERDREAGAASDAAAAEPEAITPEIVADAEVLPAVADEEEDDEPSDLGLGDDPKGSAATTLPVPAGRDLSRADALQRYLAEIGRHPLLTREEEHALAVRFTQTRDPAMAWRLVTANLRLVVKIANEYRRAAFNVLDLIQEGNVGLMQAVQKYDPLRGVKLSSYSAWWIRAYIIRYLMDNWRMVKLGTTQAQRKLFFNLRKEQEKLLAQGFDAAPRLLAERLDVSEQDVREMDQRLGNDEFSLDTPLSGGSDDSKQTYMDRLGDNGRGADEQLGEEELRRVFKEKLAAFGSTLTSEKDRFLFEHRISVPEGQEPMTLQEVGDKYGFTRERARQLEARITERLREYLRHEMPDFAQLEVSAPEEG